MSERFWYNIQHVSEDNHEVYLLVSPGRCGRGLSVVYKNIELIKKQLEKCNITYDASKAQSNPDLILFEEDGEPQIQFGDTNFDNCILRTLLTAKTTASKEVLEEKLKSAGFSEGFPRAF